MPQRAAAHVIPIGNGLAEAFILQYADPNHRRKTTRFGNTWSLLPLSPKTSISDTQPVEQSHHPSGATHTESTGREKNALLLDLMQRFERRLAQLDASENVLRRWILEIVCWAVSALSLGAIIAIYIRITAEPLAQWGTLLMLANTLGNITSAALIVPTTEALGQLKWNWFHDSSQAMWDFENFDKATRGP